MQSFCRCLALCSLLIYQSIAQLAPHYTQPYFIVTMLDPAYSDEYDGIYLRSDTINATYCGYNARKASGYNGTFFYQNERNNKFVYQEADDSTVVYRLVFADNANPQCVDTLPPSTAYDFVSDPYIWLAATWEVASASPPRMGLTSPGGFRLNFTMCDPLTANTTAICDTPVPTTSPTLEPTVSPTVEPTWMPTLEPTTNPTPAPTAYQVKYHWQGAFNTDREPFDIGWFVWIDPVAPSYSVLSILGPPDRSYLLFLSQRFVNTSAYEESEFFLRDYHNSSGWVVNPSDLTAGNIRLDLPPCSEVGTGTTGCPYGLIFNDYWEQVSSITAFEQNYTGSSRSFIQFRTPIPSNATDEWDYDFYQMLNPMQLCYIVSESFGVASQFYAQNDWGCIAINEQTVIGDLTGNYAVSGKIELAPVADIEVYFEYDPFTFEYSGYVIKPRSSWVVWGNYYQTEPGLANCTSQFVTGCVTRFWREVPMCDTQTAGAYCGLGSLGTLTFNREPARPFTTTVDLLPDNMHRINFTVAFGEDWDSTFAGNGWNVPKWLTTRQMPVNVFYGLNAASGVTATFTSAREYFGPYTLFLDYVTYAPTNAPTAAPSLAPTMAPSLAPTLAPSAAPSLAPTLAPTLAPSLAPSAAPSLAPTLAPSQPPTNAPSYSPTNAPTAAPSIAPTLAPTGSPTDSVQFCQIFCFLGDVNMSDVEIGYATALSEQSVFSFDDAVCDVYGSGTVAIADIPAASSCWKCCVTVSSFGEYQRFQLLSVVNDNLIAFRAVLGSILQPYSTARRLAETGADFLNLITYAEFEPDDAGYVDPRCDNLAHPRVCRDALTTAAAEGDFYFSIGLEPINQTVTFELCYGDGSQYFGIGFGSVGMVGDSYVYTTGKDGDLAASVYDYYMTSKSGPGITKDDSNDVVVVDAGSASGEFCVQFERDFDTGDDSDFQFDGTETSLDLFWAVGTALRLTQHVGGSASHSLATVALVPSPDTWGTRWCDSSTSLCAVTEFESNTTTGCGASGIRGGKAVTIKDNDGAVLFILIITVNCNEETARIQLTYPGYNDNWFGLVFSDSMIGSALVYTTGKNEDRSAALYAYENLDRTEPAVQYQSSKDWTNVATTSRRLQSGTELDIAYETSLSNTDIFSADSQSVTLRWAIGDGLGLAYHSQRSDGAITIDLATGASSVVKDDKTMQTVHGILMWIAWGLCCSIGIMSSAHRFIFPKKEPPPYWFMLHRIVQTCVVLFAFGGFVVALVFTWQSEEPHFSNLHEQLGLAVVIIAVTQPINALVRGHPAKPGEKKTTGRLVWEIVHKLLGYGGWLVAQLVMYFGTQLIGAAAIWQYLVLAWSGLMIVVYLILWVVGCSKKNGGDDANSSGGDQRSMLGSTDKGGVEMGTAFSTNADIEKQNSEVAFVDEDDGAPTTSKLNAK